MLKPGRAPDFRDREYARHEPEQKAVARKVGETIAPKNLFEKYEQVMQESFRSICEAVAFIKNKHLYRQVGFETFEECCEKRWGISRSAGYRLADANATLKSLKSVPHLATKISNETQARALKKVEKQDRVKVMETVVKSGPVTAARITAAATAQRGRAVIDVEPEPTATVKHCPTCRCE